MIWFSECSVTHLLLCKSSLSLRIYRRWSVLKQSHTLFTSEVLALLACFLLRVSPDEIFLTRFVLLSGLRSLCQAHCLFQNSVPSGHSTEVHLFFGYSQCFSCGLHKHLPQKATAKKLTFTVALYILSHLFSLSFFCHTSSILFEFLNHLCYMVEILTSMKTEYFILFIDMPLII